MTEKPIASPETEQALIACVLENPVHYKRLADIVNPSAFSWECFAWCWEAFERLSERGLQIDTVVLGDELEREAKLKEFCLPGSKQFTGRAAIGLIREIETQETGESYAITIQDYAGKRQIDQWLTIAHGQAHNGRAASAIMADLQASFGTLKLHSGKLATHTQTSKESGARAVELSRIASRGERAVTTGIKELDRLLYPQRGELITVAGQTGKGKSSLLATIALHAAQRGKHVKLFSLEMSGPQVAQRILSQLSKIPAHRIMQGQMSHDEWEQLDTAKNDFGELPIIICDMGAIKINQIRTESRRQPADVIMVDYIQLANADKPQQSRVLDVGEVTRGLKALAMELDIPLFAAAQLSRAVDGRGDKRPVLSDLRESGSIEQDSDSVVMIYQDPIKESSYELIIAKHRNGACGKVDVNFHPETTRFSGNEYKDQEGE